MGCCWVIRRSGRCLVLAITLLLNARKSANWLRLLYLLGLIPKKIVDVARKRFHLDYLNAHTPNSMRNATGITSNRSLDGSRVRFTLRFLMLVLVSKFCLLLQSCQNSSIHTIGSCLTKLLPSVFRCFFVILKNSKNYLESKFFPWNCNKSESTENFFMWQISICSYFRVLWVLLVSCNLLLDFRNYSDIGEARFLEVFYRTSTALNPKFSINSGKFVTTRNIAD